MSLSSKTELARALFRSTPPDSVTRISGTATADSSDGTVTVQLEDGDVIEVGTIGSVSSGDTVTIHVQRGEAQVIASEGWGDAMQAAVDEATAIAEATGQHFWHDSNGAHVTEVTQEQWQQSQTGHNILINSFGMLLRRALNYLASFTPSAVTFYDGDGNDPENVTAKFGADGVRLGAEGSARMVVSPGGIVGESPGGAAFLDVSYNGSTGTASAKANISASWQMEGASTADAFSVDVSNAIVGEPIKFDSKFAFTITGNEPPVSISSSSGCTASISGGSVVAMPTLPGFTAGTSGTGTMQVAVQTQSGTWTLSIGFGYDGASEVACTATLSASDQTALGISVRGSFSWSVATAAPAFTFGSRYDYFTPSSEDYTATLGRGLNVYNADECAVGRYNLTKPNRLFSVGNGVDETSRSNAFSVEKDGDVAAAGDVRAGGSTPLVPIGTILDFAAATAPTGYLVCDGSAVSRTDYAALFAVIGTTWGSGDGSTTFNVPDLRGRTAIGAGTGTASDATAHALGSNGGTETHKLTSAQSGVPAHYHPLANSSIVYNSSSTERTYLSGSGTKISVNTDVGINTKTNTATDASSAHPNMQPYAAVTKIIRAK